EFPDGTYHYYLTEDFPFIPRNYRGTPDSSFQKRGPGTRQRPPGPPPGGRRPF
ncbi:MAG: YHYH protein, partial [Gimesia sp.]